MRHVTLTHEGISLKYRQALSPIGPKVKTLRDRTDKVSLSRLNLLTYDLFLRVEYLWVILYSVGTVLLSISRAPWNLITILSYAGECVQQTEQLRRYGYFNTWTSATPAPSFRLTLLEYMNGLDRSVLSPEHSSNCSLDYLGISLVYSTVHYSGYSSLGR